jgi:hypothetical protein
MLQLLRRYVQTPDHLSKSTAKFGIPCHQQPNRRLVLRVKFLSSKIISIMDHLDRVAHRVSLCALTGFAAGTAYATFTGLPLRSTSIKIAGSCAIVATSLFGAERLAYAAMKGQIDSERRLVLTSHAFSGLMGGGLNGYLYQKKPLRGMFFFLPTMMIVGFLELAWEQQRRTRIKELNDAADDSSREDEQRDEI